MIVNLLVTRCVEFDDLDNNKGLGLLNEFAPRNIEEYEKIGKFRQFCRAVDASPWSDYYGSSGWKAKRRAALIFVLWSFCLAVHRAHHDRILAPLRNVTINDDWALDRIQVLNGLAFKFSNAHETKDTVFKVKGEAFKLSTLQSCIGWLTDTAKLIKERDGYLILAQNDDEFEDYERSSFRHRLLYLDLKLFDPFYKQVESLVGDVIDSVVMPKIKPDIEFRVPREIKPNKKQVAIQKMKQESARQRRLDEKVDNAKTDEEIEEIYRRAKTRKRKAKPRKPKYKWVVSEDTPKYKRSLWKKNISYLKKYTQNLSDIELSMGRYEELSDFQKGNVRKEWLSRRRYGFFDLHEYNRELLFTHFLLANTVSPTVPHAVYHLEGGNWLMGRIYGNKDIDGIKREFAPLLKIDGEFAVSIDIKSSYVQTYVLAKTKEDPRQDFYEYRGLSNVEMTRKDMKLYTLIRLNAESETSAIKAYNRGRRRGAKTLSKARLGELTAIMEAERPYVSKLYGKPKVFKEIQRIESDFMMAIGEELLKRKIPYLHHCDAMYVKRSDKEETIKVFEDVAVRLFGRKVYVGWSDNVDEGTN